MKKLVFTICTVCILQLGCNSLHDTKPYYQQSREADDIALNFLLINDISMSHSSVPRFLPENWESRFRPPGGSMKSDTDKTQYAWDAALGIEPTIVIDKSPNKNA